MALPRKFLNLIVDNRNPRSKSLRCIDLTRQRFFDKKAPEQPSNGIGLSKGHAAGNKNQTAEETLDRILLPSPIFNFRASTMTTNMAMHCFPLSGREVFCSDQRGRNFLFDADIPNVVTMPDLHKPKRRPLSLFVPSTCMDGHNDSGGGHLFIMESKPEVSYIGQHSEQFEAIVYRKPTMSSSCQLLPPPPFVHDPKFSGRSCTKISSYAVINGGSEICISVEDAGTYCLDTVKHTWRAVGEWTLPFQGKVEYVPELKLWFGLSAEAQDLAAADLSSMDSQPELVITYKELSRHKEWWPTRESQLVNLGSGRFCIARFFHNRSRKGYHYVEEHFAALTGVDVVPRVHDGKGSDNSSGTGSSGEVGLEMIKYKSKLLVPNDNSVIMAVF